MMPRRPIIAAVGEMVGLNINCSYNVSVGGVDRKNG